MVHTLFPISSSNAAFILVRRKPAAPPQVTFLPSYRPLSRRPRPRRMYNRMNNNRATTARDSLFAGASVRFDAVVFCIAKSVKEGRREQLTQKHWVSWRMASSSAAAPTAASRPSGCSRSRTTSRSATCRCRSASLSRCARALCDPRFREKACDADTCALPRGMRAQLSTSIHSEVVSQNKYLDGMVRGSFGGDAAHADLAADELTHTGYVFLFVCAGRCRARTLRIRRACSAAR